MQSRPGSFSWSEDLNESLNYWFWLRRVEGLADELLLPRVLTLLRQPSADRHREVASERRWPDYMDFWPGWKQHQVAAQLEQSRVTNPRVLKEHYEVVAAVGLTSLEVQWVTAPFGQRWLFPPDAAVLGVERANAADCRAAVLDAARALRNSG